MSEIEPKQPGPIHRYLMRTHPATLTIHAVVILIARVISTTVRTYAQAPSAIDTPAQLSVPFPADLGHADDPLFGRLFTLTNTVALVEVVAVTFGWALLTFAAARLIADAIHQHNQAEP